jgi:hypothetical protein
LISKRQLEERMNQIQAAKEAAAEQSSNLSSKTLEHMEENKRKVASGELPKYVGGTTAQPNNAEVEKQAKRVHEFIFGKRASRNEY